MKIYENKYIEDTKKPEGNFMVIADDSKAAKKIREGYDFEIDFKKGKIIIKPNKI